MMNSLSLSLKQIKKGRAWFRSRDTVDRFLKPYSENCWTEDWLSDLERSREFTEYIFWETSFNTYARYTSECLGLQPLVRGDYNKIFARQVRKFKSEIVQYNLFISNFIFIDLFRLDLLEDSFFLSKPILVLFSEVRHIYSNYDSILMRTGFPFGLRSGLAKKVLHALYNSGSYSYLVNRFPRLNFNYEPGRFLRQLTG